MNESEKLADEARQRLGFLSRAETAGLARRGILLPVPDSVLVSPEVRVEEGAIL